jgi:hypothetical protein
VIICPWLTVCHLPESVSLTSTVPENSSTVIHRSGGCCSVGCDVWQETRINVSNMAIEIKEFRFIFPPNKKSHKNTIQQKELQQNVLFH